MAVVSPHIHELWRGFRFSLRALRRPADLWPKRARFSIRRMLFQTNTPAGDCFWWAQSSVFMHMQRVTHLRSFRCVFIIDTCSAEGLWCSIFVICAHIILIHTLTPLEPACFVHQKLALYQLCFRRQYNIRGSFPLHWRLFRLSEKNANTLE